MAQDDSSSPSAPPPSAFGGPPPASAFAPPPAAAPPAPPSDLSSRWKQYEAEKAGKTVSSSNNSSSSKPHAGVQGPDPTMSEPRNYYSGSPPRGTDAGDSQLPRRAHSLTQTSSSSSSSSYDTNALIAKYAGVSGVAAPSSVARTTQPPRHASDSAIPTKAREEALQVLAMADEQLSTNQPFSVQRTESGGFRASAMAHSPPRFQRSSSSSSRRTPSALSGLGFGRSESSGSNSGASWKQGRYSFSDPKFREDDEYLEEEEDQIVHQQQQEKPKINPGGYRDRPGSFQGDFDKTTNAWSSRYSDNPTTSAILDKYDRAHAQTQNGASSGRSSARNMFMSTASNIGGNVRAFGGNVSKKLSDVTNRDKSSSNSNNVFGKGFSFKQSTKQKMQQQANSPLRSGGATATGSTNLRTVWKDDTFNDEGDMDDGSSPNKQHKTWEMVAFQKKRRRRIGLAVLLSVLAITIIGVSLSQTSWRWKYKNLWGGGNTHMDVTFYATSNTPFGYGAAETQLVADLANIPSDAEFVAHLGNLQDASLGMCPAARMNEVASLLQGKTPVPIFVVPGEHDWIRCPNQMTALGRWLQAFGAESFEEKDSLVKGGAATAASAGDFDRPKSTPEIFSKLHHGVLFIGLHLVSGTVTEGKGQEIQMVRDDKMSIFVRGTLDRLKGDYRAVVLLGNARPGPQQRSFFDSLRDDLKAARVPVAYVHAHSGVGETEHYPFSGHKRKDVLASMVGIQAASGNQPPLKITVGFGKKPFTIG